MGRRASVRYWESRGAYCCEIKGVQHVLAEGAKDEPDGPVYDSACRKFAALVCGKDHGPDLASVSAKYLHWLVSHREPETVRIRQQRLDSLCSKFGTVAVGKLTCYEVERFCDEQRVTRGWSNATISMTLSSLKSCLNWAVQKGLIEKYPLGKLEMPEVGSRGDDCILSEEQADKVVECAKRALRQFVVVLRATGARPGEIARAEAIHYDPDKKALVYSKNQKHKTRRTGKARIIYLHGEALAIVESLVKLYPSGPLFRTGRVKAKGAHKGERWGWTAHDIGLAFHRLKKKTGISGLCAYSFRHSYSVWWLRCGKPIDALAVVLGTSIKMIMDSYGHHHSSPDYLRELIER